MIAEFSRPYSTERISVLPAKFEIKKKTSSKFFYFGSWTFPLTSNCFLCRARDYPRVMDPPFFLLIYDRDLRIWAINRRKNSVGILQYRPRTRLVYKGHLSFQIGPSALLFRWFQNQREEAISNNLRRTKGFKSTWCQRRRGSKHWWQWSMTMMITIMVMMRKMKAVT